MSNKATLNLQMQYTPSGGVQTTLAKQFDVAPTGSQQITGVESLATSSTALNAGSLSGAGALMIINLDATNFVQIDSASTFDKFPQKIGPGEARVLGPQTTTLFGKADTAACLVQYLWINS